MILGSSALHLAMNFRRIPRRRPQASTRCLQTTTNWMICYHR